MTYKKFDPNLYKQFDVPARDKFCEFLATFKMPRYSVSIQEEQYKDYDMLLTDNVTGKDLTVEIEVKNVWTKSHEWQGWDTVDVPYRKRESIADRYAMFNKHMDTLLLADMSAVHESRVVTKNTIYTKNERFFAVGLDSFQMWCRFTAGWKLKKNRSKL